VEHEFCTQSRLKNLTIGKYFILDANTPGMLLIFDLDGTLMDTWEEIEYAFTRVFRRKGIPLDIQDLKMSVGLPLNEVIATLVGHEDPELVRAIRDEFLSINPRRARLFPGLEDVLKMPVKKAIFTSKGKLGTERDLDILGLHGVFDAIVTTDDVERVKPDPEGIFKILELTREEPRHTFMVGDTEMDILAAKNAGVRSIAVAWGNRSEDFLKKYEPDFIARTPEELRDFIQAHL
jgi:pyrophosphatase PpaX